MSTQDFYRIGSLYPRTASGSPNLILSSSYELGTDSKGYFVKKKAGTTIGQLTANLDITTDPVNVPGVSRFVKDWLKPQMLAKEDPNSIFNQYWQTILTYGFGNYPNNLLLEALGYLGYRGYGWDQASNNSGMWAAQSQKSGPLFEAAQDLNNYQPEVIWGSPSQQDVVQSEFDTENLRKNLDKLEGKLSGDAPLWLPSMLFTYGIEGVGTSYPGPVLMIQPGDSLNLNFDNNIRIEGLTDQQNQNATLIPNSSYGLNGGSTAGGMFSSNFHMHGGHVVPSGFGDNVVARYTSGQDWTTKIAIPKDHGQGSYWYHPHYHPAVNTQLYGGLSGFMQVGDPLQKVPLFKDVPRNVAVLKTMQVEIDPSTGNYQLAAVNGNFVGMYSLGPNRASMFTVNGEYMPEIDFQDGGWQALTLTNQDNNYYMNISVRNSQSEGSWSNLPLFIYGEDGHQYPQIRPASQGALGYVQQLNANATAYKQAENLISLPPGKRVDLLFYLPAGQSELVSAYSFTGADNQQYQINNLRFPLSNSSQYADLSSANVDPSNPNSGPGPIAKFKVQGNARNLSLAEQYAVINQANQGIQVQVVTPDTPAGAYNEAAVPSVNLYAEKQGIRFPWKKYSDTDVWEPLRKRELNYSVLALVGPEESRDIPTQKAIKAYNDDARIKKKQPYLNYTVVPGPTWLGYENPDFINDHVFPNGPLIITQLGTLEEWSLKNWNWGGPGSSQAGNNPNGGNNVGHPFHIHVNDYQVKQSDTELPNKQNLEDVTMINASGYHYMDPSGTIQKLDPLAGKFTAIPEALDNQSYVYNHGLFTTGYTDTTIRMLFQDFLGTYVHHCHLLEHEDAGMMQVVTVIENASSSWLLPAESLNVSGNSLKVRKADTLDDFEVDLSPTNAGLLKRGQVGDISGDFVQDIILAFQGDSTKKGSISIVDGNTLKLQRTTNILSTLTPYQLSNLAPWGFNSDFTGDGVRELVTGGYVKENGNQVSLNDFEIIGWQRNQDSKQWEATFRGRPWSQATNVPTTLISSELTGFAVGDFNLDNFDDYATAYLENDKLRIRIIDGAAVALYLQTGNNEGGYLPQTHILSDMTYTSPTLIGVEALALTTGFNSYAQSPIENLIVTTTSKQSGSSALTFQLDAGHFIATGTSSGSSNSSGAHQHGGGSQPSNPEISNQGALPLQLSGIRRLPGAANGSAQQNPGLTAATPTFAGVLAQGGLLIGNNLVISQGYSSDGFTTGNTSSSNEINNTTQELYIGLNGINQVAKDDLTGITTTNLSSALTPAESSERLNLAMLAYQAYTNKMVKPSSLAFLAAGDNGGELTVTQLINNITTNYAQEVAKYYGGALENLSATSIISKAYVALYRRAPSASELFYWNNSVRQGLAKTNLPVAILQGTAPVDQPRIALLSAATRWSQVQWGTSPVINGDFGQGYQSDVSTFDKLSEELFAISDTKSWTTAQASFDAYRSNVIDEMNGTPVGSTGFF